ncbi:DUF4142 domain-containing protein [Niabella sp. CC-SYL272]|uniref:DUF4142 domain-containing protein n=1 Tax=Niabella agricola TaxID=2891571 RepID=UPI001F2DCEC9|nr:DUF4142 domain-containing protein [Niabella agricola]MCF3108321.1 DUF4142 domain-containing protein [Niabella agricola]
MKTISTIFVTAMLLLSCGQHPKTPIAEADSTNQVKQDSSAGGLTVTADSISAAFLVRAADNTLKEGDLAALAQQKATIPTVKDFAGMLSREHKKLNETIKDLAAKKNITIPPVSGDERTMSRLSDRSGSGFDRAYINEVIDEHKSAVSRFEDAVKQAQDPDIKAFADQTLPELQKHLDSAKSIKEKYWK